MSTGGLSPHRLERLHDVLSGHVRRGAVPGLVAVVAVVAAFIAAQPAPAASWAQPQIKVVVANGLMGPSVSNFRAKQNVTRKELGEALAALTGEPQIVVDPDAEVSIAGLDAKVVKALGLRHAAKTFQRKVKEAGLEPDWTMCSGERWFTALRRR